MTETEAIVMIETALILLLLAFLVAAANVYRRLK